MPRSAFFSKEEIIAAALRIVRSKGMEGLSARSLSKELNCSLSPIFTVYENMDQIKNDVRVAAGKMFDAYVEDVTDYMPAFKEYGMRLVRFAAREPVIFRILFLEKEASYTYDSSKANECLQDIRNGYGLSQEQTDMLFRQMWPLACGLAMLSARNPEAYSEESISEILSCEFSSMMYFIKSGKEVMNITPHTRRPDEKTTLEL